MPAEGSSSPAEAKPGFLRHVAILFGAAATSQLVGILATPILSRIFAPEAFGLLALFLSYGTIVGTISCLRYDYAVMLPADDDEAASLLALSVLVATTVALLCAMGQWAFGDTLLRATGAAGLAPYFGLVPAFIWLTGISQAFRQWFARKERFGDLAAFQLLRGTTTPLAAIAAGLAAHTGPAGLLFGRFVGLILQTAALGRALVQNFPRPLTAALRPAPLWRAARRHWRFPLLDTTSVFVFNVGKEAPVFLFTLYLGETVTGYYGLTILVLQAPASMVLAAVGQVLFQVASARHAAGEAIGGLLAETLRQTLTLATLPVVVLGACGPTLFAFAFGSRWREAGLYAAILSPWLLSFVLSNATAVLFRTLERQDLDLLANLALLVVRIGALWVGTQLFDSAVIAIALMSGASALVNFRRVGFLLRETRTEPGPLIRHGAAQAALAIPAALAVVGTDTVLGLAPLWVLGAATLGAVPYAIGSAKRDPALLLRLQNALASRAR